MSKQFDDQDDILSWMKACFAEKRPGKTQAALARAIGRDKSAVTLMLSGNRKISRDELVIIREFFGSAVGGDDATILPATNSGTVRVMGRIGEHTWMAPGVAPLTVVSAAPGPYPAVDQIAYEVIEATPDGSFQVHDMVYTVPFDLYRGGVVAGDIVVVEGFRNGLRKLALRRAGVVDGEVELLLLAPVGDIRRGDPDERPIGLFIGHFRPFQR